MTPATTSEKKRKAMNKRLGDRMPALWAQISKREDGCWDWLGNKSFGSAPLFRVEGKTWRVNILLKSIEDGIPPKNHLHRSCSNDLCMAPAHWQVKNLSTEPIENETELVGLYRQTARQAAQYVSRRKGLRNCVELEDLHGEALLALVQVLRHSPATKQNDERYLYWKIVGALGDWAESFTRKGRRYDFLDQVSLEAAEVAEWYQCRDILIEHPDLTALDHCFLDALNESFQALPHDLQEAFPIGADRGGEDSYSAGERLGISGSALLARRASADAHLLGLLQSRGWLTGVEDE